MSVPRHFIGRAKSPLYWGVAWGVAVGLVEYLAVAPIDDWVLVQQLIFWLLYWMVPYWCAVGCLFVVLADRYDALSHRGLFLATFILLCAISSSLQPLLSIALFRVVIEIFPGWQGHARAAGAQFTDWSNWSTLALYQLWETSFYGAILVAARILTSRGERTRQSLHDRAVARIRTEGLLDSVRLESMQSQIDSHLLLDSMQELANRYRGCPESAERLLEALVNFLRHAMHGLRVPVSTLDAELRLAIAFSQLQRERGVKHAWSVASDPIETGGQYKFPSLLILPLMALSGECGQPMLRVQAAGGQAVLSFLGLSRSISSQFRQQVNGRLYALYGENFAFEPGFSGAPEIRIVLRSATHPLGDTSAR